MQRRLMASTCSDSKSCPLWRIARTDGVNSGEKQERAGRPSRFQAPSGGGPRAGFFRSMGRAHAPTARRGAGYSFVSGIPEMTPWGKALYETTKTSWGPRAVEDSTDLVNPTTGNELDASQTGVPRIYVHPFRSRSFRRQAVYRTLRVQSLVRQNFIPPAPTSTARSGSLVDGRLGRLVGRRRARDRSVGFNDKTMARPRGPSAFRSTDVVERITRPKQIRWSSTLR